MCRKFRSLKIWILKRLLHTKLNLQTPQQWCTPTSIIKKRYDQTIQPATINQVEKVQSLLSQDLSFIHTSLNKRAWCYNVITQHNLYLSVFCNFYLIFEEERFCFIIQNFLMFSYIQAQGYHFPKRGLCYVGIQYVIQYYYEKNLSVQSLRVTFLPLLEPRGVY